MSPIELGVEEIDLAHALAFSTAVVGSPAAAAETIVASITLPAVVRAEQNIVIAGWLAYTAGTSAVSARKRIKRTDASGATKADSGLVTVVAASLYNDAILGFDTGVAGGQVYVMTLIMGSGAAVSTVSAVGLAALIL